MNRNFLKGVIFKSVMILVTLVSSFSAVAQGSDEGHSAKVSINFNTTNYAKAALVAEYSAVSEDAEYIELGVLLSPNKGWHAYWSNPGDVGKGIDIQWQLPEGFEASSPRLPTPHVIPFMGLNTYGYEGEVLVTSHITLPEGLVRGAVIPVSAVVSWVVCDDKTCVPESTELSLELNVGPVSERHPTFAKHEAEFAEVTNIKAAYQVKGDQVHIQMALGEHLAEISNPYLFVESRHLVTYSQQTIAFTPQMLTVVMDAASGAENVASSPAILSFEQNGEHQSIALQLESGAISVEATHSRSFSVFEMLAAVLAAFIGGLILNLMPCVFPVLSLKVLSLSKHAASDDSRAIRQSGHYYTLGVVCTFTTVALILVALRSAGQALGWGFQMQSPGIVLLLAMLMLAISLNLFGVFEMGTRMTGAGQSLVNGGERRTAFFTGLLAVVVATPCTAPFMASSLAYALSQPVIVAMAIFISLGFGLAFPYLLLCYLPKLSEKLPQPGPWMEVMKKLLAFPMLAAAVWLIWVLGQQLGVSAMAMGLVTALMLSMSLWMFGQSRFSSSKRIWQWCYLVALIATIVSGSQTLVVNSVSVASKGSETLGSLEITPFDPTQLANDVDHNQPVFLYFTADWCISCKVNERVALATDSLAEAFKNRGIKVMKADWTSQDPEITEWLAKYDRIGVPLYLYFPRGATLAQAVSLPQLLTTDVVINEIDHAEKQQATAKPKKKVAEEKATKDKVASVKVVRELNKPLPLAKAASWEAIDAFLAEEQPWMKQYRELRRSGLSHPEASSQLPSYPDATEALAHAHGIILAEGEQSLKAAEFMAQYVRGTGHEIAGYLLALKTVLALETDKIEARRAIAQIERVFPAEGIPDFLAFLDALQENSNDPAIAATARFYIASTYDYLNQDIHLSIAQHKEYVAKALAVLEGFDKGAEDERFVDYSDTMKDGSKRPQRTIHEKGEALKYSLEKLAIGQVIPEVSAPNLSGEIESLSQYRGKYLLVDFWATWCGPCMASIPKMAELKRKAQGQLEILSVSVDGEQAAVDEFLKTRSMPWAHWYIGAKGQMLDRWQVRGFPTYILLTPEGELVARATGFSEEFEAFVADVIHKK